MSQDPRHTTVTSVKRDQISSTQGVYFMDHPTLTGRYVLGTGNKDTEATAFLGEVTSEHVVIDDDPNEETRKMFLANNSRVVI